MTHAPTMVSLVETYLAARRQMGFALGIAGGQLFAFGRFADQAGHCGGCGSFAFEAKARSVNRIAGV